MQMVSPIHTTVLIGTVLQVCLTQGIIMEYIPTAASETSCSICWLPADLALTISAVFIMSTVLASPKLTKYYIAVKPFTLPVVRNMPTGAPRVLMRLKICTGQVPMKKSRLKMHGMQWVSEPPAAARVAHLQAWQFLLLPIVLQHFHGPLSAGRPVTMYNIALWYHSMDPGYFFNNFI